MNKMINYRPTIAGIAAMVGITALVLTSATSFKLMGSFGGMIKKLEVNGGPIQRESLLEICNATQSLMGAILALSGISILAIVVMGVCTWDLMNVRYSGKRMINDILAGTQQVDSAEASTIAVPPSEPSGSPR